MCRAAYDGPYHHMGSTSTTVNVSLRIPEEKDRYRIDSWEAQMVDNRETWTFKAADEARRVSNLFLLPLIYKYNKVVIE